jgi:hypothetical protein
MESLEKEYAQKKYDGFRIRKMEELFPENVFQKKLGDASGNA